VSPEGTAAQETETGAALRRFEGSFRVRFDEAGPDGLLRASGHVRYLQDLAWQHSEAAGFDRAWYRERGLVWLVRAVDLSIVGSAAFGDALRASTRVAGWRRFWARRESEVRLGGSAPGDLRPVARAGIDWVLLDDAGRPTRVPKEIEALAEPGTTFTPIRVGLPGSPATALLHRSRVRPQDLDPMGHVNNASYLDYVEEALLPVTPPIVRVVPRRIRLEYVRPALPGAELTGACWPIDGGWAYRLVDGTGEELLRASVIRS
jgi:acyl-CoA thioesterase FadM